MSFTRRLAVALVVPIFVAGLTLIVVVCAFDRVFGWLGGHRVALFARDPRSLQRRSAWCVARLKAAGALAPEAVVTAFEVIPFKQGEAFRSSLARVRVTFTEVPDPTPRVFECLAKFAPTAGSLLTRAIFILQKNHTNEVGFYRHIGKVGDARDGRAPSLQAVERAIRPYHPRVYHAVAAPLSGHFIVLLERVPDIVEHTEEVGATLEAAQAALRTLARFHALHWARPGVVRPRFPPPLARVSIDFACALAFGRECRVLRQLARDTWNDGNFPQTILHGDARVGNMLFPRDGDAILIDWQALRWGRAAYDVAYFMLLSLPSALRETHEAALIEAYHAALTAHGVTGFTLDELREDYRASVLLVGSLLVIPLLGGEVSIDDANRARILSGGLVWNQRLQRAAAAIDPAWLERRFGVDAATFRATVAHATLHPPRLNRPACLVAEALAHGAPSA